MIEMLYPGLPGQTLNAVTGILIGVRQIDIFYREEKAEI
jgi:hypothetical protein